jgi:hypothetical protein
MNGKNQIKKLEIVPLRKAFPNEAHDLTPWLADNLDALGERLGIGLTLEECEKPVGDFSLDLFCQDADGRKVIIENQLEQTDHDHLGKLMTYLVNLGAKTAIWITSSPRPEHQRVVEWLNETMPDDMAFYLVKVEAIKVGDSSFSPLFNLLTGPDRQTKKIGQEKKEWAQRHHDRVDFWRALFANEQLKRTRFCGREPQPMVNASIPTGVPRSYTGFSVGMRDATAYLTFKFDDSKTTKALFEKLLSQKQEIEKEFGEEMTWQEEQGNRWLWIGKFFANRGLKEREAWPSLHQEMAGAFLRLETVMRDRLRKAYEEVEKTHGMAT